MLIYSMIVLIKLPNEGIIDSKEKSPGITKINHQSFKKKSNEGHSLYRILKGAIKPQE